MGGAKFRTNFQDKIDVLCVELVIGAFFDQNISEVGKLFSVLAPFRFVISL